MKHGVYLPSCGAYADARVLAELAHDAETAGWDGFFIWDHMMMSWPDQVVDPWIALTAVAMTTKQIRFGPLVTSLSRRRPWKVARETASLDRLSNGRLILGVGLGYASEEFAAFGDTFDPHLRAAKLDEGLDILTGLWSGKTFSYQGDHYQIQPSQFLPTPHQSPRIPIWVAGFWPNKPPFRRASRWDGVFPLARNEGDLLSVTEIEQMMTTVKQERTADTPLDVVLTGSTSGTDLAQGQDTITPYAQIGVTWWLENINPWRFGWDMKGAWPTQLMRERIQQGPPKL